MSRMNLDQNAALREQGWRVFRSSTRDRLIPQTGSGATLQRIKIASALPVLGVFEGVALPVEARAARAASVVQSAERAIDASRGYSLDITKHIYVNTVSVTGNPDVVDAQDESFEVGRAPFDGFITEFVFNTSIAGVGLGHAVRTQYGQTMFFSTDFFVTAPFTPGFEPDFVQQMVDGGSRPLITLRDLKIPIVAGEAIFVVTKETPGFAAGQSLLTGVIGLEAFVVGNLSARAQVSTFRASSEAGALAARAAAANANRLAIEREKTRRLQVAEAAETVRLGLKIDAAKLAQRAPAPVPPPRVRPAPPEPPEGAGKTFVSAWNPSFGMIGYLIPDPPRGGKVNVFDNRYTIWDITGKNVGQGPIIPVASDGDIPPGARISPIRSGTLSEAIVQAQLQMMLPK